MRNSRQEARCGWQQRSVVLCGTVMTPSNRYQPLQQFLYLDALELAPEHNAEDAAAAANANADGIGSTNFALVPGSGPQLLNYEDAQRLCVGRATMARLARMPVFVVGSGAIGASDGRRGVVVVPARALTQSGRGEGKGA
jgi:hypothetical protein